MDYQLLNEGLLVNYIIICWKLWSIYYLIYTYANLRIINNGNNNKIIVVILLQLVRVFGGLKNMVRNDTAMLNHYYFCVITMYHVVHLVLNKILKILKNLGKILMILIVLIGLIIISYLHLQGFQDGHRFLS